MDVTQGLFRFVSDSWLSNTLFAAMFLVVGHRLLRRTTVSAEYSRRLWMWFLAISAVQLVLVAAVYWIEWHAPECGEACQFFFPPYSNYYLNEVLIKWIATWGLNASVGLIGGFAFLWFARRTGGRIIDQLDVDFLTVGGMVAGWPNILVFYGLVFVLTIGLTVLRAIAERSGSVRMIITPVLPIAAAIIALFGDQLSRWLRLYEIGVTVL